jgi:sulfate transport system permease protein
MIISLPQRQSIPIKQKQSLPWGRYFLITLGLGFLALVVLFPLVNIFYQAFAGGITAYWAGLTTPEALHAISLTLIVVAVAIPINIVFGLLIAWIFAKHQVPGKVFLLGILDLPLAISPTIAGLMIILLYSNTNGIFAPLLEFFQIKVVFALPGIILTTIFVTFPFVAREVLPVLQSLGTQEEEAAQTLGANSWQIFWRVTLPSIRWALLYGVILSTSRGMGEFGAVSVVSGKLINETNTLTLHIERAYTEYQTVEAFACSSFLAILAIVTLIAQELLSKRE